jgi:phytoene synthase
MLELPLFRARARTFWFAARFLPSPQRDAVNRLYAFARVMDDLVDEPEPSRSQHHTLQLLSAWRGWLEHPDVLRAPDARLATTVLPLLLQHGVPVAYLQSLLDGVASDVGRAEIQSWPELRAYCVQVASSVGLAMCHLLGAGDDPLARDAAVELGIAMQLTNILRDIAPDLRMGRVYLPADELAEHGSSAEHLGWLSDAVAHAGPAAVDDAFRAVMRAQIERARDCYARGLGGLWRLPPDCQLAIFLAGRLYAGILDEVERSDYDVFSRRAATSTWFKVREAIRYSAALRLAPELSLGALAPPQAIPVARS